jgi:hypothetical protein
VTNLRKPESAVEWNQDSQSLLELQDTAGSERYESLSKMFYRGAWAAVVCFDLSDSDSFDRVKFWVTELKANEEVILLAALFWAALNFFSQFRNVEYFCVEPRRTKWKLTKPSGKWIIMLLWNMLMVKY